MRTNAQSGAVTTIAAIDAYRKMPVALARTITARGKGGAGDYLFSVILISNDEAILRDGESIGHETPGGYAQQLQKSMMPGYVPV